MESYLIWKRRRDDGLMREEFMEIHHRTGLPSTVEPKPGAGKKADPVRTGIAQIQIRKPIPKPIPKPGTRTVRQDADCGAVFWFWAARQDR